MSTRRALLSQLALGDIIHAAGPGAPSQICLITAITGKIIQARSVTTQLRFEFDIESGIGAADLDGQTIICTIDSVCPIPVELHNILLGLDRKFRLENDTERLKLTEAEQNALLYVGKFYPDHPLPLQ